MSKVTEELEGRPEITLYNLAKLAVDNGDYKLFKKYRHNHAYSMKKYFEREKATAETVTR